MNKLWLLVLLLLVYGLAYAHGTYQGKAYTFHGDGHTIDVQLDQNNVLSVSLDTRTLGTRDNFCTPIN